MRDSHEVDGDQRDERLPSMDFCIRVMVDFKRAVCCGPRERRQCALTFDRGPIVVELFDNPFRECEGNAGGSC